MHVHSSMGRGVTEGGIAKDMKRILSLSYYDLPPHLKPCLLYLSIFPEDFSHLELCQGFSSLSSRSLRRRSRVARLTAAWATSLLSSMLRFVCSVRIPAMKRWRQPRLG
ncbi:unnamed protein product [Triticum turgidum subsp. durum]|uniref:Uncharacterized protein n=1 Tax=Triticum turgidum subsp. durum TaxID=4567 RepID=A0A9R1BIY6_TRITD|nr:unnamed protein product [Triticum turgidum subsp. durum]